jgi:hypothetical protein
LTSCETVSSARRSLLHGVIYLVVNFVIVEVSTVVTALIQINWDGQPFGYAENPDDWIFL